MALFNRVLAVAALLLAFTGASFAVELTPAQYESLTTRILSFDAAMKAKSVPDIMGVVPPKVLDKIASNFNVSSAELVAATQQQFDEAMKSVEIISFGMDIDNAEIMALADGTPYALIPTETVMARGAAGGKLRARSSTLGLPDGEACSLVPVADA